MWREQFPRGSLKTWLLIPALLVPLYPCLDLPLHLCGPQYSPNPDVGRLGQVISEIPSSSKSPNFLTAFGQEFCMTGSHSGWLHCLFLDPYHRQTWLVIETCGVTNIQPFGKIILHIMLQYFSVRRNNFTYHICLILFLLPVSLVLSQLTSAYKTGELFIQVK